MVPDELVEGAPVMVIGQNPGATEVEQGKPFCGQTGEIMEGLFFPVAGLVRGENVSIANTFRCRLGHTNDVPNPKVLREASEHCWRAYGHIPKSTKLVIAQGSVAWNFTGHHGLSINDWRGHLGPHQFRGIDVYAVLHLADLTPGRNPRMTLPSRLDWGRIPRILKGEWPVSLPPRLIVGECEWGEVLKWFSVAQREAPYIAWDTEFDWGDDPRDGDNYQMTMVSLAYPGMEQGVQLLWRGGHAESWQKSQFIQLFWNLASVVPHVGHNFTAELKCVEKTWGWDPSTFWGRFEDTMLAHAVLWSEFAHSLNFLESVYSPYPKIKHLPTTDPLRNWGDTCLTVAVWEALKLELEADPESESVYRNQSLRLIPHVYHRERTGLAVNKGRVGPAIAMYTKRYDQAVSVARSYCGYPINLGSPAQLAAHLYDIEGIKAKGRSTEADAIATLRTKYAAYDAEWEATNAFDEAYLMKRISEGAHPLLEALTLARDVGYVLTHYLEPLVINETP
jgi:uracil-DNA glycosylase family 4